jgi:hypothetical protein
MGLFSGIGKTLGGIAKTVGKVAPILAAVPGMQGAAAIAATVGKVAGTVDGITSGLGGNGEAASAQAEQTAGPPPSEASALSGDNLNGGNSPLDSSGSSGGDTFNPSNDASGSTIIPGGQVPYQPKTFMAQQVAKAIDDAAAGANGDQTGNTFAGNDVAGVS